MCTPPRNRAPAAGLQLWSQPQQQVARLAPPEKDKHRDIHQLPLALGSRRQEGEGAARPRNPCAGCGSPTGAMHGGLQHTLVALCRGSWHGDNHQAPPRHAPLPPSSFRTHTYHLGGRHIFQADG